MNIEIRQIHKSINKTSSFALPSFSVITGKNGSGKSHLLEAISNTEKSRITDEGKILDRIRYIPFNGLNPAVDEQCDINTITTHIRNIWIQFSSARSNIDMQIKNGQRAPGNYAIDAVFPWIPDTRQQSAIRAVIEKSRKKAQELSEDDFRKYLDLKYILPEEMFAGQFATVFKNYHIRKDANSYARYRSERFGEKNEHLADEDFETIYGPAPWILINSILENAHLPYRVNSPEGQNRDSLFKLVLVDKYTGLEISITELSTGEKVLMSLALAVYNSTSSGDKLDLLLLDEPDAALHPEFSKVLIDTLSNHIVNQAKVNVIITTHSPTTVATCEGISIFEMSKIEKMPIKRSQSDAINLLTEGLRGVRISNDRRRQVFVESFYDSIYYEKLYECVRKHHKYEFEAMFLPTSKLRSNCNSVEDIASKLASYGNDTVYGLLDFDGKRCSKSNILVIGENKRYAIENYIFDPIFVFLLILEQRIESSRAFGIDREITYIEADRLCQSEIQEICNAIVTKLEIEIRENKSCVLLNGFNIDIPKEYLLMKGHDLETLIIKKWPGINGIIKGSSADNILKEYMLTHIIMDYSKYLSEDLLETFLCIN